MRRPILAGNWKMHKTVSEALDFVELILPGLIEIGSVDRVLCPPFTALAAVRQILRTDTIGRDTIGRDAIGLGAQNMHWAEEGAFTGEISPRMVQELCDYVILGHSERRAFFDETDERVNRKVKAALAHGITPIVCVGETEAEHDAGRTDQVVSAQVRDCLADLSPHDVTRVVVAYEPVWAIGTGKAATVEGAGAVIANSIRGTIARLLHEEIAQAVRVQYGGSVKPGNIAEFMAHPDIDGALVGGASLKPDFVDLVRIAAESAQA